MCGFFLSFLIFLPLPLSVPKGRNAPGKPVREVSEMQAHCHGFCLSQLAFCAQHACDGSAGLLGFGEGRGVVSFRFGSCLILLSAFPMCALNSSVPLNFQWRRRQLRDLHVLTSSQRWKLRNGEEKIIH